jgi:hypothetical protein
MFYRPTHVYLSTYFHRVDKALHCPHQKAVNVHKMTTMLNKRQADILDRALEDHNILVYARVTDVREMEEKNLKV